MNKKKNIKLTSLIKRFDGRTYIKSLFFSFNERTNFNARTRTHNFFFIFISFPLSLAECYKLQWHIAHDIRYTGMSICVCTTRDMASVSIWSSEISFFNFLCQFHSSFFLFLRLLIILKWFHLLSFDGFFFYISIRCACAIFTFEYVCTQQQHLSTWTEFHLDAITGNTHFSGFYAIWNLQIITNKCFIWKCRSLTVNTNSFYKIIINR